VVAHFAKTSTTKGTKVHQEKAVEFKTFVALCVHRGSGFCGRIAKVSHHLLIPYGVRIIVNRPTPPTVNELFCSREAFPCYDSFFPQRLR
jgi:hypothetical protein